MALSNVFANLTSAVLSQLDTNFNQVGAMGVTACTLDATSTANAIVLDVAANQTSVSAYNNYQLFSFVAGSASTGSVTVQVGSLAALNLYLHDGVTQAGSGNISASVAYLIVFNSALNSGVGGFQIVSQMPVSSMLDLISTTQGSLLVRGPTTWGSLAPGASGTFLKSQGPGAQLAFGAVSGATSTINILTFGSAGSFSFSSTSGINTSTVFKVTLVGGGGGGGGSNSTTISGAGGGGGGGIAIVYVSGLSANTFYSGAIGAGGAPGFGGSSLTNGSAGGATTISFGGVQFVANGGTQGWRSGIASGGSGGSVSNATINIAGSPGFTGGFISGVTPIGGAGGDGIWGGGGQAIYGGSRGQDGQSPGAGGSGAATAGSGGSGATGIFMMEWIQ